MTIINAIYKSQNATAFSLLEQVGFNPNTTAKTNNLSLELTDSDDDVVMLIGDNINVNAKNGNNTVYVIGHNASVAAADGKNDVAIGGDNANVSTGNGKNSIQVQGDNAEITSGDGSNTVSLYGDNGAITLGNGNNNMRVYGDNTTVSAGTGKNELGFIGDNSTVNLAGKTRLAYWGNNNTINVAGNSSVYTVDKALKYKQFTDMEEAFVKELDYTNSSQKVNSQVSYDYTRCSDSIYSYLPEGDAAFAETVDMEELVDDKYAKYVIMPDQNGQVRLYVYSYTYKGKPYYYPYGQEGDAKVKECIEPDSLGKEEVSYDKYDAYTMIYSQNYMVDGVSGNKVTFGDGDNILRATYSDGSGYDDLGTATTGHILEACGSDVVSVNTSANKVRHDVITRKYYTIVDSEE